MYYKEFLRARNSVYVFTLVSGILFLLSSILTVAVTGSVEVSSSTHAPGVEQAPWPALFGAAAFAAAIVATVLGSTLSQENDGHLELALTKPYSRVAYATTSIAIDLAAIAASLFIAFGFILLHMVIFHHASSFTPRPQPEIQLVAGPDPFFNALRFVLFPLAWYAVIVGLSAGLRGKAGIVQGLIWPVALGLAALREVPTGGAWQVWHNFFVALNALNPLIYISYQDRTTDATVQIVGAAGLPAIVSVVVLAAFLVAGWAIATLQWRRVEA